MGGLCVYVCAAGSSVLKCKLCLNLLVVEYQAGAQTLIGPSSLIDTAGGLVSVSACVLFAVLEVRSESWMKQSAQLSLSNPILMLSSCVPGGNTRACQ